MADGVSGYSDVQIQSNYEKYKEFFATDDSTKLGQDDFLKLMVEQLKNQDFNNPTDNAEFIAQMAQFSTLQAQQNMTFYSQASYAASLVGKKVSVGASDSDGTYITDTGMVTAVSFANNDFTFTVNGRQYSSKELMRVETWTADDIADSTKDTTKTDTTKTDTTGTDPKTDETNTETKA